MLPAISETKLLLLALCCRNLLISINSHNCNFFKPGMLAWKTEGKGKQGCCCLSFYDRLLAMPKLNYLDLPISLLNIAIDSLTYNNSIDISIQTVKLWILNNIWRTIQGGFYSSEVYFRRKHNLFNFSSLFKCIILIPLCGLGC